jgi:hypothetical protein
MVIVSHGRSDLSSWILQNHRAVVFVPPPNGKVDVCSPDTAKRVDEIVGTKTSLAVTDLKHSHGRAGQPPQLIGGGTVEHVNCYTVPPVFDGER